VAIVVVTHDGRGHLDRCLSALQSLDYPPTVTRSSSSTTAVAVRKSAVQLAAKPRLFAAATSERGRCRDGEQRAEPYATRCRRRRSGNGRRIVQRLEAEQTTIEVTTTVVVTTTIATRGQLSMLAILPPWPPAWERRVIPHCIRK